jgi:glycosyltransferase involved in cell wall biosynthesis
MVSSLKIYKGVFEFVALAEKNSSYEFKLVLNATPQEIDTFFKYTSFPKNLIVYPSQTNTHPFYEWADVLVNLSRPDGWIETFGLTVIEAMGYQLPCIVPPIGGIAELVAEGENGFLCDSRDGKLLSEKLTRLLEDKALYKSMQDKIRSKITLFSEDEFIKKSLHILDTV